MEVRAAVSKSLVWLAATLAPLQSLPALSCGCTDHRQPARRQTSTPAPGPLGTRAMGCRPGACACCQGRTAGNCPCCRAAKLAAQRSGDAHQAGCTCQADQDRAPAVPASSARVGAPEVFVSGGPAAGMAVLVPAVAPWLQPAWECPVIPLSAVERCSTLCRFTI
jgi:hypothetical protein